MILHLTLGSEPIEVHVHGEFAATRHVTLAPRLVSPALSAPARAHSRRWPLAALPIVALLASAAGYHMGSTALVKEVNSLVAQRDDDRRLRQSLADAFRSPDGPLLRTLPPANAATTAQPDVPAAVAQVLAQPPAVTPAPGTPGPATALQPPAPGGRNPFGLE